MKSYQYLFRSIFIWLWEEPVSKILQIFDDTVMLCLQKKEAGIFNEKTRIYFFSKGKQSKLELELLSVTRMYLLQIKPKPIVFSTIN